MTDQHPEIKSSAPDTTTLMFTGDIKWMQQSLAQPDTGLGFQVKCAQIWYDDHLTVLKDYWKLTSCVIVCNQWAAAVPDVTWTSVFMQTADASSAPYCHQFWGLLISIREQSCQVTLFFTISLSFHGHTCEHILGPLHDGTTHGRVSADQWACVCWGPLPRFDNCTKLHKRGQCY